MKRWRLKRVVLVVGVLLLVAWTAMGLLFDFYRVPSEANSPTLEIGDRVIAWPFGSVDRGDIVVYELPDEGTRRLSRVVAVAGDSIEATSQGVSLNGFPLDEPYLDRGVLTPVFEVVVIPEDHVFLMSDNRPRARDSRIDGPVPVDAIMGKLVWIWSPLGRVGRP